LLHLLYQGNPALPAPGLCAGDRVKTSHVVGFTFIARTLGNEACLLALEYNTSSNRDFIGIRLLTEGIEKRDCGIIVTAIICYGYL